MPRGRKKTVKQPVLSSGNADDKANVKNFQYKEQDSWVDQEVERKVAAIRAIRDVEIEHLVTGLRLLRSYISEEQMDGPAAQFFNESLPNVSVIRDDRDGQFEMQWKENDANPSFSNANLYDLHASLLRRMSIAYSDCSTAFPYFGGLELSSKTVKTGFLNAENLQIRDLVLDEPSDSQMMGLQDTLRTPGLSNQMRLSIGMTPKSLRQPKPGEMLLSVHGSPLGVYKEEDMEPIKESDET
ncbi:uncharacterized protein LOC116207044 [Punica granatum]|uniref:Uncharacterized protein LOC116207044 n=2 Tax=Punica granatum TaxID=22663 RepID=A0A6P8DGU5_PUNGR|nr:uncharacterized protein LOC116207044 [Punica granatum]PKI76310.1 hypothetical protein CRG98_003232 [Punica granatum]